MTEVEAGSTLAYYKRLFPFKSIYNWLNHQHPPTRLWTNREFAFTLPGDVYMRWNSFATAEDLKREVCRLNPSRFEIGAIYSARVCTTLLWIASPRGVLSCRWLTL